MMKKRNTVILITISMFLSSCALADQNKDGWDDLAQTPPMGWNSWNTFRLEINEKLVRDTADMFAEEGFKDAGYGYIVIDDGWQIDRDTGGNIVVDKDKFPSGIKALADYIHSKGLKFGIYSDAGYKTCGGFPGSRGYEYQDARQYAAWGVDYLKYDWCYTGNQSAPDSYRLMRDALEKAGRPIVFSICEWGTNEPWKWGKGVGHLWRTTYDIRPCWDCSVTAIGQNKIQIENFLGFTKILDQQVGLESYAGPGHWNDPDMLEVGNGELTIEENRSHFSLWCMLASPLMLGNDIRQASPEVLEILLDKEAIAVNQDPLGKQGVKVRDDGDREVWSKVLNDGSRAVVLFNRGKEKAKIGVQWTEIGYPAHLNVKVRDIWKKKDLGLIKNGYRAEVVPHGVAMLRVKP
jgi:alpha-galactosidase